MIEYFIEYGYNSRLDTIQAVVAKYVLDNKLKITSLRRRNADFLDRNLSDVDFIKLVIEMLI